MFIATGVVILLLALLFWAAYPQTEYAGMYSESKFRRIAPGMSAAEVRFLLGTPLQTTGTSGPRLHDGLFNPLSYAGVLEPPWYKETWRYTGDEKGGPLDKGYRVRNVCLSNDVVVKVERALVWSGSVWPGW